MKHHRRNLPSNQQLNLLPVLRSLLLVNHHASPLLPHFHIHLPSLLLNQVVTHRTFQVVSQVVNPHRVRLLFPRNSQQVYQLGSLLLFRLLSRLPNHPIIQPLNRVLFQVLNPVDSLLLNQPVDRAHNRVQNRLHTLPDNRAHNPVVNHRLNLLIGPPLYHHLNRQYNLLCNLHPTHLPTPRESLLLDLRINPVHSQQIVLRDSRLVFLVLNRVESRQHSRVIFRAVNQVRNPLASRAINQLVVRVHCPRVCQPVSRVLSQVFSRLVDPLRCHPLSPVLNQVVFRLLNLPVYRVPSPLDYRQDSQPVSLVGSRAPYHLVSRHHYPRVSRVRSLVDYRRLSPPVRRVPNHQDGQRRNLAGIQVLSRALVLPPNQPLLPPDIHPPVHHCTRLSPRRLNPVGSHLVS